MTSLTDSHIQHAPKSDEKSGAADVTPHMTLRPSSGWAALNLRETWQFRDLLLTLAGRDLKLRYKQTALGVIWVILQPLMAAGIFSFVFGMVAGLKGASGVPYIVFSYAGLLGWNLFNNTLTKASGCLLGNAHLISKVFFPRLILPLSGVPSTLVDFAVALIMLAVLMIVFQISPTPAMLALPVWMLLLMMMAMGAGMMAAALSVSYRDVQYILPVFMQILLYASPIAYSASEALTRIPEKYQIIFYLNPLTGLLEAFRWSLLGKGELSSAGLLYSASCSVIIMTFGAFMFKRMEKKFADVI